MSYPKVKPHPYDGFQCEGKPKGRYTEYGGIPTYTVVPGISIGSFERKYNGVGLLYLSDKSGICHDSMMLADQFAEVGLHTIICDYVGSATDPNKQKLKTAHRSEAAARKIIDDTIKDLIDGQFGGTKRNRILIAGFGCGVRHVLRLLAQPDTPQGHVFVAGFIASPDAEPVGSVLDYSAISKPLSLAFADDRNTVTKGEERERIRDALLTWSGPYQINIYSHVRDNFAVRRAVASKAEVYAKRQAFAQALQWFNFHLFGNELR
ncbi:hypothetical protein BKA65DRAFT_537259 [Rhexocercosporidium sp. MPI-PUGE-AT-0058]|nr:hypothetical protein BKA65DRAFT_537259 [Rhexocercosporidium sp. MPI-PUGE-AT-0058]